MPGRLAVAMGLAVAVRLGLLFVAVVHTLIGFTELHRLQPTTQSVHLPVFVAAIPPRGPFEWGRV